MKIVYLTSRFPYPLEKGDKLRAYYQIQSLALDHDVHLVSISDTEIKKSDLEMLRPLTASIHLITITPLERYKSILNAISSGLPYQIAWFYSSYAAEKIHQIATNIKPDHIFCQLPRMAEYAIGLPISKTLDYMDCFGVGMYRRAQVARGIFAPLYRIEATRMIKYEAYIANKFDHLTIISEQDKRQFNFERAKDICVISNGISPTFFEYPKNKSPEYDLIFVGNMSYLPNIESVEYLITQVVPLLNNSLKILIAGINPASRIQKLSDKNIVISGWIDDIRSAYANAKIFVAPMWSGTGQQNKILEAMAMGLPCITTSLVNNAIGAKDGTEILLAEDATNFAKAIQKILQDHQLYNTISKNSTHYVRQNFNWNQNSKLLSSIFAAK